MDEPGSVTVWINRLKLGDANGEAVYALWGRYFKQLVTRARERLRGRSGAVDGEDVALSAFDSFVRAAERGRFPRLNDRADLWQILLVLTARKASNLVRDEGRQKRGGAAVVRGLAGGDSAAGDLAVLATEPDPAEAAALAEEAELLLQSLGTDELRRIAVWAFEGYSNVEIAARLGRSVATAERKLRRIREIWATRMGDASASRQPE
jgi:DNA-directed RNA polymerase specialized sigma24 family protein